MSILLKRTLSFYLTLCMITPLIAQSELKNRVSADKIDSTYGDVNNDNKINIADLIKMKSYLIEKNADNFNQKNSDLDLSSDVSQLDYLQLSMYFLGQLPAFATELANDRDNDGVCDYFETEMFGTDPDKTDSDGDGLSDYVEIFIINTDPCNKFTDNSQISDDKKDSDEDGLSNLDEILLNTSLILSDTDGDGLSDYDEVKVYNSDPLLTDTDGDGLSDRAETILQTDPNKKMSDGTTSDNQRSFFQSLGDDNIIFSDINNIEGSYKFSVDLTAKGLAEENLEVTESSYTDFLDSNIILGKILDISYKNNESQKMTIKFTADNIDNYCIFKYNKDASMIFPLETQFNGNTAYVSDAECGTYCLVDMKRWIDDSTTNVFGSVSESDSKGKDIFFIEYFPTNDDIKYGDKRWCENAAGTVCSTISDLLKKEEDIHIYCAGTDGRAHNYLPEGTLYLDSNSSTDAINRSAYYCYSYVYDESINKHVPDRWTLVGTLWGDSSEEQFYLDEQTWKSDRIYPYLASSNSRQKYCIVIDNGSQPICKNAEDIIDELKNAGVNFSFYYGAGNPNSSRYKQLASGNNAHILNEYTFLDDVKKDISKQSFVPSSSNIYYSLMKNYYLEKPLDSQAIIDYKSGKYSISQLSEKYQLADTDKDGVYDIDELNVDLLQTDNKGNITMPDYESLTRKFIGESVIPWLKEKYYGYKDTTETIFETFVTPFRSNPNRKDSDGDGINDDIDKELLSHMDPAFVVEDKYSKEPKDLVTDCVKSNYEQCSELYNTQNFEKAHKFKIIASMAVLYTCGLLNTTSYPNASFCLKTFLNMDDVKSKTPYKLVSDMDEIIYCSPTQLKSYCSNMNQLLKAAESVLKPGNSLSISATENGLRGVGFSFDPSTPTGMENDMYLSVHSGDNTLFSKVKCTEDEKGIKYTANVKYYLFDCYDWNENESDYDSLSKIDKLNPLITLQECSLYGISHPFCSYSCVETTVSWRCGQRYPVMSDSQLDLNAAYDFKDKLDENGIDDTAMKKSDFDIIFK